MRGTSLGVLLVVAALSAALPAHRDDVPEPHPKEAALSTTTATTPSAPAGVKGGPEDADKDATPSNATTPAAPALPAHSEGAPAPHAMEAAPNTTTTPSAPAGVKGNLESADKEKQALEAFEAFVHFRMEPSKPAGTSNGSESAHQGQRRSADPAQSNATTPSADVLPAHHDDAPTPHAKEAVPSTATVTTPSAPALPAHHDDSPAPLTKAAAPSTAAVTTPTAPAGEKGDAEDADKEKRALESFEHFRTEPSIAVGMFSSGKRRRSADSARARLRRQDSLSEEVSVDSETEEDRADAEAGPADLGIPHERKRSLDFMAVRTSASAAAGPSSVASPFSQTSDMEDEHRVRKAVTVAVDSEARAEDIEPTETPTEEPTTLTPPLEYSEDHSDVSYDHFSVRKVRATYHDSEDEDVYVDLDHEPLPVFARTSSSSVRQRRQVVVVPGQDSEDVDQPDYRRERKATVMVLLTRSKRDRHSDSRSDSNSDSDSSSDSDSDSDSDSNASDSSSDEDRQRHHQHHSSTESPAVQEVRRSRRSPQRGSFDGFVLSDFSGFGRGRRALSDAEVVKVLLEAPVDESILGELPVRRSRQAPVEQLPPAMPATFILPLPAQPAAPAGVVDSAPGSAPVLTSSSASVPVPAASTFQEPVKVLQIYSEHNDNLASTSTTTSTTPSPAAIPVPAAGISVPAAAVDGLLESGPVAHIEIVTATYPQDMAMLSPVAAVPSAQLAPQAPQQPVTRGVPELTVPQAAPELTVPQAAPVLTAPRAAPELTVPQAAPVLTAPQAAPELTAPQAAPEQTPGQWLQQQLPPPQSLFPQFLSPESTLPLVTRAQDPVPAVPQVPSVPQVPMVPQVPAVPQDPMVTQVAAVPQVPTVPQVPMVPQDPAVPQGPVVPPRQHFDVFPASSTPVNPAPFTASAGVPAVPIVAKTIQTNPDGSFMYSYETADGTRVSETGMQREIPAVEVAAQGASPNLAADPAASSAPGTRLANTVSGGYSYTAPDGTFVSLRYIADENGFRPLGESLPSNRFAK